MPLMFRCIAGQSRERGSCMASSFFVSPFCYCLWAHMELDELRALNPTTCVHFTSRVACCAGYTISSFRSAHESCPPTLLLLSAPACVRAHVPKRRCRLVVFVFALLAPCYHFECIHDWCFCAERFRRFASAGNSLLHILALPTLAACLP